MQSMNLDSYTTVKKINSKWITDLNIRPKSMELQKRTENFYDFGLGKIYQIRHKEQKLQEKKVDQTYFMKNLHFWSLKDILRK